MTHSVSPRPSAPSKYWKPILYTRTCYHNNTIWICWEERGSKAYEIFTQSSDDILILTGTLNHKVDVSDLFLNKIQNCLMFFLPKFKKPTFIAAFPFRVLIRANAYTLPIFADHVRQHEYKDMPIVRSVIWFDSDLKNRGSIVFHMLLNANPIFWK